MLPRTKASSFKSSSASQVFSLASPQHNFATMVTYIQGKFSQAQHAWKVLKSTNDIFQQILFAQNRFSQRHLSSIDFRLRINKTINMFTNMTYFAGKKGQTLTKNISIQLLLTH